jgi:hypothetical protein
MRAIVWVGVLIALAFCACSFAWLGWDNRQRRMRLTRRAQQNVARVLAEMEARNVDPACRHYDDTRLMDPASPHPDRSCDKTCDIQDSAHGDGGIFVIDGDDELLVKWAVVNWVEDDQEPASSSELALRVQDEVGPAIAGNPFPMARTGAHDDLQDDHRSDPVEVTVRVLDSVPDWAHESTGYHDMVSELALEDRETAEDRADRLFRNDPLGSWVLPAEDSWEEAALFNDLAHEWMEGGEEWPAERQPLELSGATL